MTNDSVSWKAAWTVDKYTERDTDRLTQRLGREPKAADFEAYQVPREHLDIPGNVLVTAGVTRLVSLILGNGGQALTATAVRVGVGDSSVTVTLADTDLNATAGAAHRQFNPLDTGYPTNTGGIMAFVATFGPSVANFTWNEFGLDVGTPTVVAGTTVNALLLNHKLISVGAKTVGQTWVAAAQITLA